MALQLQLGTISKLELNLIILFIAINCILSLNNDEVFRKFEKIALLMTENVCLKLPWA